MVASSEVLPQPSPSSDKCGETLFLQAIYMSKDIAKYKN